VIGIVRIECIECAAPKLGTLEIRPPTAEQLGEVVEAGHAPTWPFGGRGRKPPAGA
jgi:hypothetical protein